MRTTADVSMPSLEPDAQAITDPLGGSMKCIVAALVVVALVLTGCTASDVNTQPDLSEAEASGATEGAEVGQPITISGNEDGSKIQVTVKKVVMRTRPTDQFFQVDEGKRLVAVQFRLVNTGTVRYWDAPSNGAKVVDKDGQQFESDIFFHEISAGPMLPASVKLAPRNKALGYIAFQVPRNAKITQIQFSMDSGFGDTAQWNVK